MIHNSFLKYVSCLWFLFVKTTKYAKFDIQHDFPKFGHFIQGIKKAFKQRNSFFSHNIIMIM